MTELIERLEAAESSNALDVLCEVALFRPGTCFTKIRPNTAGTKVIYTDKAGHNMTCWAEPWSEPPRRAATIAALKAHKETNP